MGGQRWLTMARASTDVVATTSLVLALTKTCGADGGFSRPCTRHQSPPRLPNQQPHTAAPDAKIQQTSMQRTNQSHQSKCALWGFAAI